MKRELAKRCMDLGFQSYPAFPNITRLALQRVQELGGTNELYATLQHVEGRIGAADDRVEGDSAGAGSISPLSQNGLEWAGRTAS